VLHVPTKTARSISSHSSEDCKLNKNSLADFQGNSLCTCYRKFHHMLLYYLVKFGIQNIMFMQRMTTTSSSNANQLHFSKHARHSNCMFEKSSVGCNASWQFLHSLVPFPDCSVNHSLINTTQVVLERLLQFFYLLDLVLVTVVLQSPTSHS